MSIESTSELQVDSMRAKDLVGALQAVSQRVIKSANGRNVFFSLTVDQHLTFFPCFWDEKLMRRIGKVGGRFKVEACL